MQDVMEKTTLRNVTDRDLDQIVPWLLPSLQKDWPRLAEDNLRYWLRAAINDRTAKLCRTDLVVGLYFMQRDVLEPDGVVREKFFRHNKASADEQRMFYRDVREWARSIKARYLIVNEDSNCEGVKEQFFGGDPVAALVRKKNTYVVSFDK